jgi:hypothetical protein
MARPGVIGVGEGRSEGQPCLLVFVSSPPGPPADLPASLEGYPIVIEPTGPLIAQLPR